MNTRDNYFFSHVLLQMNINVIVEFVYNLLSWDLIHWVAKHGYEYYFMIAILTFQYF